MLAAAALLAGIASTGLGEQLPGTLGFRDVTGDRIVQVVAEIASNDKQIDTGDYDNDGDLDVVVASGNGDFGQRRNKLYLNAHGTFVEVSGAPVIPGFAVTDVSRQAFFRDYDRDGWVDILVVNDSNTAGDGGRSKLYLNRHEGGMFRFFEEVGEVYLGSGFGGAADDALSEDLDLADGFDVFVGNQPNTSQNRLYLNTGAAFFQDVTALNLPPESAYNDDVAAGDMNGDGLLDLVVTNQFAPSVILYNDHGPDATGPGDFSSAGSVQTLDEITQGDPSITPIDVDGDGRLDLYWIDKVTALGDRVLHNAGNDASGHAILVELPASVLPPSVHTGARGHASVADLNGDGRSDLVVTSETGRPAVLRNVSVSGTIGFVDWTPGNTFPDGDTHRGDSAALFDSNNDGDLDILLGGDADDHLFENVPSLELAERDVGGVLPDLFDGSPVALVGSVDALTPDTFSAADVGAGFAAVIANGTGDLALELLDARGDVIALSDRGGIGVEEALQVAVGGPVSVRVSLRGCAPSSHDLDASCDVGIGDLLVLLAAWGENRGHPADFSGDGIVGILDLVILLGQWGPVANDYVLEVLARG